MCYTHIRALYIYTRVREFVRTYHYKKYLIALRGYIRVYVREIHIGAFFVVMMRTYHYKNRPIALRVYVDVYIFVCAFNVNTHISVCESLHHLHA